MKASKKLKVLRVIVFVLVLIAAYITYSVVTGSLSKQYEQAKQSCGNELWLIARDGTFYDVRRIQQPYPSEITELTGEKVVDFACTKQQAEEMRQNAKAGGTVGFFFGLSIFVWGPFVPIVIIWWFVEELKYWKAKAS